jgi:hypothetical protein
MRVDARVELVTAIVRGRLWQANDIDEAMRQHLIAVQRAGVEAALRQAPAAADLWLAMAALATETVGFGEQAQSALAASYLFAPRASGVVRPRLLLAAPLYPLLSENLRQGFRTDIAVIRHVSVDYYTALLPLLPEAERLPLTPAQ